MSLTFACPECKVQIEVPDEYAGQSGQCPRCQNVIVIPTPKQPPVSAGAGRTVAPPVLDPVDFDQPRRRGGDESAPRPRRARSQPRPPSGPLWPWVVGVAAALLTVGLLLSSFIVLVSWRRSDPMRANVRDDFNPFVAIENNERLVVGRLEGNRAVLDNGVFQVRSALTQKDDVDPDLGPSRCKIYEVQLRADRTYVIDVESNQLDCRARIESSVNDQVFERSMPNNRRGASLTFRPPETAVYLVFATTANAAFGEFTLTIREANRPKPFVAP